MIRCQSDKFYLWVSPVDSACRFDGVRIWVAYAENCYMGLMETHLTKRCVSVLGSGHDVELVVTVKQTSQAFKPELLSVDKKHPDNGHTGTLVLTALSSQLATLPKLPLNSGRLDAPSRQRPAIPQIRIWRLLHLV
jgi:hypothetical protein